MGRRPALSPSEVKELYRDLKKNMTGKQLAEKYGVSRQQIYATYQVGKKKNKGRSFEGLFPYPGSKRRFLQSIVRKASSIKPQTVVETCAGSSALSMNITAGSFVLNDLDENVVNLLSTLKNKRAVKELEPLLLKFSALCGTEQKDSFKTIIRDQSTDIERARAFYLTLHCGFGAVLRYNAKGQLNTPYAKVYKHNHQKFKRSHELLVQKNPAIANGDMLHCIEKNLVKAKSTLFFVDPPYIQSQSLYKKTFSAKDLVDLYQACREIKKSRNNFILTFSQDSFALSLFQEFKTRKISTSFGIRGQKASTEIIISSF
jgi:site-specific DNA-adenine methylase